MPSRCCVNLHLLALLVFSGGAAASATAFSGSCYDSYNVTATTCDEVEISFNTIGCTCYTCTENGVVVTAYCNSPPISCDFKSVNNSSSKTYNILFVVYPITAFVLAFSSIAVAYWFPNNVKELTTKDIVQMRMKTIARYLYRISLASFIQRDGSAVGFVDYFCNKKELLGLFDSRKKAANTRSRWMRLCATLSTLMVTISLALVLGTIVHNDRCYFYMTRCCSCRTFCNYENVGCTPGCQCIPDDGCLPYYCEGANTSISETMEVVCNEADSDLSNEATVLTAFFTIVVSTASSVAISSAEDGSLRQKFEHVVITCTAVGLLIFGILYSGHLTRKQFEGDSTSHSRRTKEISQTLLKGWGFEQVVSIGLVIVQYGVCWVCYKCMYTSRLVAVKSVAAIHPKDSDLDKCIIKTDEIATVKDVTLQPPKRVTE